VGGEGRPDWYRAAQWLLVDDMIAILFYFLPAAIG
jgi:hypothetical protein